MGVSQAKSNFYFVYGLIIVVAILVKVGICICAFHIYNLVRVYRRSDRGDNVGHPSEGISLVEQNAQVSFTNNSQAADSQSKHQPQMTLPSGVTSLSPSATPNERPTKQDHNQLYPTLASPQSQTVQGPPTQYQSYPIPNVPPPSYGETIC